MRILFLTGSLEPGRDGVGDYTRALAGECARQGHTCGIIALHDRALSQPVETSANSEAGSIPILRLPASLPWSRRVERANAFRTRLNPEWISLQFVPYGFNDRGLVHGLAPHFQAVTGGCRVHLMLHELWIGADRGASLRRRLVGRLQRLGIRRMIKSIRPQVVSTSNPAYRALLKDLGTRATLLPLHGNIPLVPLPSPLVLPAPLLEAGFPSNASEREGWWIGLFFGGLHPEWQSEPLITIVGRAAKRTGRRVCLVLAGRPGTAGEEVWRKLRQESHPDTVCVNLGEQPAAMISLLLQIADFGLASSPWQLIGKSGAVAAMLDHGLPVIVTRDDYQLRVPADEPPSRDPLFHRCDDSLEDRLVAGLPKARPRPRLEAIAGQFLDLLGSKSDPHAPTP